MRFKELNFIKLVKKYEEVFVTINKSFDTKRITKDDLLYAKTFQKVYGEYRITTFDKMDMSDKTNTPTFTLYIRIEGQVK